jgi:selenocysteine-specific elongation factor
VIVATAGHIDHGKTVLVKALTGVDTDRLPEEKRRGVSIDLGFAYASLGGDTLIGFVDVPGHERFVRNMLAGVTGIDFALLVVAADDGPMPQTIEHLAILDLLGLRTGAVALTKIDRVAPDRVPNVQKAIESLLEDTGLAGAPVFPVSGLTGDGIPALRDHLIEAGRALGQRRARGRFRLAVDRSFTLSGAGLVVTGTVFSGAVRIGDRLMLSPSGKQVRVRSIHAQNREAESGYAGQRCALNIAGADLDRQSVHRGDWILAAPLHAPTDRIDVRLRTLASERRALRHWTPVHIHLGAADVTGRVAMLDGWSIAPGASGRAQLVLDRPVGALHGDRLIIRDQSAQRTIGGGSVIDPFSPRRGRRSPERLVWLDAMENEQPDDALASLLAQSAGGIALDRFALIWNLGPEEFDAITGKAEMVRVGRPEAPVGLSPENWAALGDRIVAGLADWHRRSPDQSGPAEERLRQVTSGRMPPEVFSAAVVALIRDKRVMRDGSSLCLPGHRPALAAPDAALWERIQPLLDVDGLRPPRVRELAEELGVELRPLERLLNHATRMGMLYRVADNRYYLPETVRSLARKAEQLAGRTADNRFDARAYRDATGIGRNVTIQVLEFFDRQGLTRRVGDHRQIAKPAAEVFG